MRIIRTTNPNGTYRYEIDGKVHHKASRVRYTHASSYRIGTSEPVLFHRTENAAHKANGYRDWVKVDVLTIEDGDQSAPAPVKVPRIRSMVRVNDTYPTATFRGAQGRVVNKHNGDDGRLYVHVNLGTQVWPFVVSELDLV